MAKKHETEKEGQKTKKGKAARGALPVLPAEASAPGSAGTDAAHATGDAHAELINHSYLTEGEFDSVAETLQRNLATTIALYLKFKKFHWDIRGRLFHSLHLTYDEMAAEVFESVDVLAERLVMLGGSPVAAPGLLDRLATVQVPTATLHDARAQLEQLVADHDRLTRALRDDSQRCDDAGDPATADLYNGLLLTHDEHRWMLQAMLDDRKTD